MQRKDYEMLYGDLTNSCIVSFKRDDSVILASESDIFDEGYSAEYPPQLLEHFKSGNLHLYWFWKYAHLFDRDDLWTGCAVQREGGNHFGEWLGAIILNHYYNYISLVEKYDCPGEHKQKVIPTKNLLGDEVYNDLIKSKNQPPDLLMYKDADYFFCEVKRRNAIKIEKTTDNQPEHFKWVKRETKQKILLLALIEK